MRVFKLFLTNNNYKNIFQHNIFDVLSASITIPIITNIKRIWHGHSVVTYYGEYFSE